MLVQNGWFCKISFRVMEVHVNIEYFLKCLPSIPILISPLEYGVAITSYKIAKNVWFYVSQFKYANTIETLGTLAKSGTPNPL